MKVDGGKLIDERYSEQWPPLLWSPSLNTKQLKEDSVEYYRDPNAARYPR